PHIVLRLPAAVSGRRGSLRGGGWRVAAGIGLDPDAAAAVGDDADAGVRIRVGARAVRIDLAFAAALLVGRAVAGPRREHGGRQVLALVVLGVVVGAGGRAENEERAECGDAREAEGAGERRVHRNPPLPVRLSRY